MSQNDTTTQANANCQQLVLEELLSVLMKLKKILEENREQQGDNAGVAIPPQGRDQITPGGANQTAPPEGMNQTPNSRGNWVDRFVEKALNQEGMDKLQREFFGRLFARDLECVKLLNESDRPQLLLTDTFGEKLIETSSGPDANRALSILKSSGLTGIMTADNLRELQSLMIKAVENDWPKSMGKLSDDKTYFSWASQQFGCPIPFRQYGFGVDNERYPISLYMIDIPCNEYPAPNKIT